MVLVCATERVYKLLVNTLPALGLYMTIRSCALNGQELRTVIGFTT